METWRKNGYCKDTDSCNNYFSKPKFSTNVEVDDNPVDTYT